MAKRATNSDASAKALGKYMEELQRIRPLDSSDEIRISRQIAEQEKELWLTIFDGGREMDRALSIMREALKQYPDRTYSESAEEVLKTFGRRSSRSSAKGRGRNSVAGVVSDLADRMCEVDVDREIVSFVVRETTETSSMQRRDGDRSGSSEYAHRVKEAAKRVEGTKNGFIRANLAIVVYIAQRYKNSRTHLEDLVQEGNLGLIKAVDRFDYRQGFRFSTYAAWWVKAYINRSISKTGYAIRIPEYALRDSSRLSKATEMAMVKEGRQLTREELAEQSGLSQGYLSRMERRAMQPVFSLDEKISGMEGRSFSDTLVDSRAKSPYESAELGMWAEDLDDVLQELTPLERTVIRWRFGLGSLEETTLKKIGDRYGLSRERIRQIQEQALEKLRRRLSSSDAA